MFVPVSPINYVRIPGSRSSRQFDQDYERLWSTNAIAGERSYTFNRFIPFANFNFQTGCLTITKRDARDRLQSLVKHAKRGVRIDCWFDWLIDYLIKLINSVSTTEASNSLICERCHKTVTQNDAFVTFHGCKHAIHAKCELGFVMLIYSVGIWENYCNHSFLFDWNIFAGRDDNDFMKLKCQICETNMIETTDNLSDQ